MDFLELAKKRYSVRSFLPDSIPNEMINKILQAGLLAPTACNKQPQEIIVVESAEGLEKLRKCTECHFNAPLAFIISYNKSLCWKRSFDGKSSGDIDASIVATHMMLEAADLGIGSTWVMYFIPEAVKTEFEFSNNAEPTAILVMGYPSANAVPSPQHSTYKEMCETVIFR